MRTQAAIKKAVHRADGTARNKLHSKTYLKTVPESRLKLAIGEILLFSNAQRSEFWSLFEVLLIQYIELKHVGGQP